MLILNNTDHKNSQGAPGMRASLATLQQTVAALRAENLALGLQLRQKDERIAALEAELRELRDSA